MVAVLVVLTFIALVAINYYLARGRAPVPGHAAASRGLAPRPVRAPPVPAGVFVQPSWTWCRFGETGEVYVGVHPLLLDVVGGPLSLDCRRHGATLRRGEPLVELGRGERRLTVRSPISGTVELVNYPALGSDDAFQATHSRGGSWLYRVRAGQVAEDSRDWLAGDAAASWTRRAYRDLREFVQARVPDRRLGLMMADGGDLPAGILGDMDDEVWAAVQRRLDRDEVPEATP